MISLPSHTVNYIARDATHWIDINKNSLQSEISNFSIQKNIPIYYLSYAFPMVPCCIPMVFPTVFPWFFRWNFCPATSIRSHRSLLSKSRGPAPRKRSVTEHRIVIFDGDLWRFNIDLMVIQWWFMPVSGDLWRFLFMKYFNYVNLDETWHWIWQVFDGTYSDFMEC